MESVEKLLKSTQVTEKESHWLLPTVEARSYKLRAFDVGLLWVPNVPMCYYFPEQARIDPEIFKDALLQTLEIYPIMAGRLRVDDHEQGRAVYSDLRNSKGVNLQICSSTLSPPESEENSGTDSWKPFYVPKLDHIGLREHGFAEPLFRAKLTALDKGGCVLCLSFVHALTDGDSIVKFVNTLSYNCGVLAGIDPTPNQKPDEPELDRAIPLEAIEGNSPTDAKSEHKVDYGNSVKFLAAAIPARFLDVVTNYVLEKKDVDRLKKEAMEILPDGEWVSSYEIMTSMMLRALAIVDDQTQPGEFKSRFLVNSRTRGIVSSKNYFGNALAYPEFTIEHAGPQHELGDMALEIHNKLRAKLKDGQALDKIQVDYEIGMEKDNALDNRIKRAQWVRSWAINILEDSPICNSWLGYNWLDLDFGSGHLPGRFWVPVSFSWRRHMFISPRTKSQYLVRIHLSSADSKKFEKAVKELNFPLSPLPK